MTRLVDLQAAMRACRLCLDDGHDITPGAVFTGRDSAQVMIIGQAPGVTEVTARRPFNAGSGRRLFQWLGAAGWDETAFRARHYMTSVTKCFPGKAGNGQGDRVPSRGEQALCRPFLAEEIRLVRPQVIIPVGGLAIKLFFPARLKLTQIIGQGVYFQPEQLLDPVCFDLTNASRHGLFQPEMAPTGRWVIPLPHPSGASLWPNKPANKVLIDQAVALLDAVRRAWRL